jgi:hypothetical protein
MRLFLAVAMLFLWQNVAQQPPTHKKTDDSQSSKTETAQITSVNQSIRNGDKEQPTRDPKYAYPYDAREDFLYRWYMRMTIVGVVGGFIGIAFLYYQSTLIRESIGAAHRSADAVMDSEMAVVSVYETDVLLKDNGRTLTAVFDVCNVGRTIALIFAADHLLQISDDADNPPMPQLYDATDESSATTTGTAYLPPDVNVAKGDKLGDKCIAILSRVDDPPIGKQSEGKVFKAIRPTEDEWKSINDGGKFLWCYGFARYSDVFKRDFEVRFCFRYAPNLIPSPGFISYGPPEFNRLQRYTRK